MLQSIVVLAKFRKRKCLSLFIYTVRYKNTLVVHRSAFDHCSFFAAGYVGCMKELNINGANIDLVSYAHQQDSGKRWGEGRGEKQCCQLLADFSGQFGGKVRQLR